MRQMEKIRILADTSSDLTFEEAGRRGIALLSIPVFINGKQYADGVDFTKDEFYATLERSEVLPTTSHIPPVVTSECYLKAYHDGCEAIIHVCNNSVRSGMFNTANMCRDLFFEEHPEAVGKFRIEPVDSRSYSLAYGYPVILGAELRDKGGSVDEILALMQETINRAEIYLSAYDLRYAKNSGRLSALAAFAGGVLGIRPIISMIDGETKTADKVRGDKAVVPRLVKTAEDFMGPDMNYCVIHGYDFPDVDELEAAMRKRFGKAPLGRYQIGGAVSINIGPKSLAVAFLGRDRRASSN